MSRHRAEPDDEEEVAQTPATPDTGPLPFGHGAWPTVRPPVPNGTRPAVNSHVAQARTPSPDLRPRHQQTDALHVEPRHLEPPRVERTPVKEAPVKEAPVEEAPVERRRIERRPVEQPPHEQSPNEHPPDGEGPVADHEHPPPGDLVDGALVDEPTDEPVDELGLLTPAPAAEKGHRRGRRTRPPSAGRRRPLAVLLSLGVIAALVTGIFFGGRVIIDLIAGDPAADYSGQGTGTVEVEIPEGASTVRIADVLFESDVVASAEAFLDAASGNPDVMNIQPGFYQMRMQMSGEAAVSLILDPASKLLDRATIPEGYTAARTLESLAEQTDIPLADFQAAAAAPDQLGLPDWANGQLEGFLYPATYDVRPDTTAVELLTSMVAQFNRVATETGLETNAAALGLTPYQLLTVASLVQSEVTVEAERPLVARVIYNRLAQNIVLGIDAALAYELGINGGELTTEMLNTDSPYNTRTRLGLPPTPISNPGQPSIVGALIPAPGDWIYYVLQNLEGDHFFTANYEEFLAAKAQCEAAGLGCG